MHVRFFTPLEKVQCLTHVLVELFCLCLVTALRGAVFKSDLLLGLGYRRGGGKGANFPEGKIFFDGRIDGEKAHARERTEVA